VKDHLARARRLDELTEFGQGSNRYIFWFFQVKDF
jgi:hypothetical protein